MCALYRNIPIEGACPELAPQELAKVEALLGVPLPDDFVAFLKAAHGGNCEFIFDAGDESTSLGGIFSVGPDEYEVYGHGTMLGELEDFRRERQLPPGVLPFAQGGGDIYIFLDLTETGHDRVVIYLPGLPGWTGQRPENRYVEVAPSFDEFLNSLRIDEEEAIENLREAIEEKNPDWVQANYEYLDLHLPGWREKYSELAT